MGHPQDGKGFPPSKLYEERYDGPMNESYCADSDEERLTLLHNGGMTIYDRVGKAFTTVKIPSILTIANVVLFLTSVMILLESKRHESSLQEHWKATSAFSPVFNRFSIPKESQITNGTFWDTDPPSIWRERTGAAADQAWESVGSNVPTIIISAEDVLALGKDPAVAVKVPLELNHGPDAYVAGMDVFHHLHCLDKIRREVSYEHYHEVKEGPRPGSALHEAHINHCFDILAQALKCTSSVDIVTFNWVQGKRLPQPDFNNNKVCRDFEAVRRWTFENGIDVNEFFRVATKPPPGAVVVPEFHPGKDQNERNEDRTPRAHVLAQ